MVYYARNKVCNSHISVQEISLMKDIEQALSGVFKHAAAGNTAVLIFRIIVALILLWIFSRIIETVCRRITKKICAKTDVDPGAVSFIATIIRIVLYMIAILMILNGFGVRTSSLLTLLGSIGLAVVLGLKDNLSNVASGIIIMILKPFKVGDHISEANTHSEGTVTDIGLFFTKLKTLDEKTIIVPNQILSSTSVTNHTAQEYRTLDLHYAVPYGTDIDRAKDVIRSTILADQQDQAEKTDEKREQHEQIFDPGSIHIFVYELGDSAVILCSRSRVLNENYWPTRFRILEDVYNNFKKAGIEFAYPHMDVHIDS